MSDYFYSLETLVMDSVTYSSWTDLWNLCFDLADEENQ